MFIDVQTRLHIDYRTPPSKSGLQYSEPIIGRSSNNDCLKGRADKDNTGDSEDDDEYSEDEDKGIFFYDKSFSALA